MLRSVASSVTERGRAGAWQVNRGNQPEERIIRHHPNHHRSRSRLTEVLTVLGLVALAAPPAGAQAARERFPSWVPREATPSVAASGAPDAGAPTWRLAVGGTLAALGSAGLTLALAQTCADGPGDDACEWTALSAGVLASAFAVPGGVQVAGSRRSYGRLLLASVGGMFAGWLVAEGMHGAGVNGEGLLLMVPIVQIGMTTILGR